MEADIHTIPKMGHVVHVRQSAGDQDIALSWLRKDDLLARHVFGHALVGSTESPADDYRAQECVVLRLMQRRSPVCRVDVLRCGAVSTLTHCCTC